MSIEIKSDMTPFIGRRTVMSVTHGPTSVFLYERWNRNQECGEYEVVVNNLYKDPLKANMKIAVHKTPDLIQAITLYRRKLDELRRIMDPASGMN